ncbi:MAG: hypothetical protein IPO29_16000 [Anaerolineae bacterium]|nr:hypothetical protein [Anaerolineae bacterium]
MTTTPKYSDLPIDDVAVGVGVTVGVATAGAAVGVDVAVSCSPGSGDAVAVNTSIATVTVSAGAIAVAVGVSVVAGEGRATTGVNVGGRTNVGSASVGLWVGTAAGRLGVPVEGCARVAVGLGRSLARLGVGKGELSGPGAVGDGLRVGVPSAPVAPGAGPKVAVAAVVGVRVSVLVMLALACAMRAWLSRIPGASANAPPSAQVKRAIAAMAPAETITSQRARPRVRVRPTSTTSARVSQEPLRRDSSGR